LSACDNQRLFLSNWSNTVLLLIPKRWFMNSRRTFVITAVSCGSAIATGLMTGNALAQAKLDEKDPQAVGLGYVADSTKADKKKYTKHANDQKCTNCQLFQGKATDAAGGCPLFAGKQVAGAGWCSAWAKKA
jgi:High potential iron-sulfur protein